MQTDNRRYHIIIEQTIDIFVNICQQYIKTKGLEKKVWVIKDEQQSVVTIGDPDKLFDCKDFGFAFYYEMILSRKMNEAVDEFIFKLEHFIKHANATGRFSVFRTNDKTKK